MVKVFNPCFCYSPLLLVNTNAQFDDMESWGLMEMIEYGSDIFQFKHRDSSVKKQLCTGKSIPLRSCPDSVLFTEIIRVNKAGFVKSVEIISQKPTKKII